jgi:hypothetical protein
LTNSQRINVERITDMRPPIPALSKLHILPLKGRNRFWRLALFWSTKQKQKNTSKLQR